MANTNDAVMAIAKTAFQHFQQGVATGNWQPYLDMLIEDYYFSQYKGDRSCNF